MINILRKNQRMLWFVIAILAIPFVFYFGNDSWQNAFGASEFGRIYGRNVSRLEIQRNVRLFELARDLGMFNLLQDLTVGANTEDEAHEQFVWNRIVLREEAKRLGIRARESDIAEVVRNLRPFRSETGFNINRYNQFVQTILPSMGFRETDIEELAADEVVLNRIKELLATGVQTPEIESKENYERINGKMDVAVVRFRSEDLAKDIKITDEDVLKYYEANKAQLKSEEKRKVEFVMLALSDEQKALAGKERVDALQKLADRANDFSEALLQKGADFHQVAAKFELPIKETGEFTVSTPDPQLTANPQLAAAAFQLTPQDPNSEALQVSDSFCVLHLSAVNEARPLSLEEAKPKIVEMLKEQRVRAALAQKGAEAVQKIREARKSGAPLDAVAKELGLNTEKIPPFSFVQDPELPQPEAEKSAKPETASKKPKPETVPREPAPELPVKAEIPDLPVIKQALAEMNSGEVSEFIPAESGGLIAILEKRQPVDTAEFEKGRAEFDARFLRSKSTLAFYEWLRERRKEAGAPVSVS